MSSILQKTLTSVDCVACSAWFRGRYVVGVGWDKHVNVYADSVEDVRQVQEPQQHWPDDIVIIALHHCI